jgi:hypothetical protein
MQNINAALILISSLSEKFDEYLGYTDHDAKLVFNSV